MSLKHNEFIVAINSEIINRELSIIDKNKTIYEVYILSILENNTDKIVIKQRKGLENDPTYRQLIPYVILRQEINRDPTKTLYFPYRRTSLSGEQRLHGKVSIGYGGHINLWKDAVVGIADSIDIKNTILNAAIREINEELSVHDKEFTAISDVNLDYDKDDIKTSDFLIISSLNPVDSVHLGIIFFIDVYEEQGIQLKELEMELLEPMTCQQLLNSNLELEGWTRYYLEHIKLNN